MTDQTPTKRPARQALEPTKADASGSGETVDTVDETPAIMTVCRNLLKPAHKGFKFRWFGFNFEVREKGRVGKCDVPAALALDAAAGGQVYLEGVSDDKLEAMMYRQKYRDQHGSPPPDEWNDDQIREAVDIRAMQDNEIVRVARVGVHGVSGDTPLRAS